MKNCQKLKVKFRVSYQGWGEESKGELIIHLKNERKEIIASWSKSNPIPRLEWIENEVVVDNQDGIVRLYQSNFSYEVWYKVGKRSPRRRKGCTWWRDEKIDEEEDDDDDDDVAHKDEEEENVLCVDYFFLILEEGSSELHQPDPKLGRKVRYVNLLTLYVFT
jgi:hypothetical protein